MKYVVWGIFRLCLNQGQFNDKEYALLWMIIRLSSSKIFPPGAHTTRSGGETLIF